MSEIKRFQAPAIVSKITTMSDNTLRLQVDCQEMPAGDEVIIIGSRNKYGWFLFQEGEESIKNIDLPNIPLPAKDKEQKTKSQTLRAVLYRLWQQTGKKDLYGRECDSETHYNQSYDKLIEHYKGKLE